MTAETETTPEVKPDAAETESQPERPEWLPAKFKTPEDLVDSNAHAVKKITEMGQENKALRDDNEILTKELETLLAERDAFEERIGTLERGLLNRLVGRRGA